MTSRDRKMVLWLRDFMDTELGVVEYRPTVRRLTASKAMLTRWLAADDNARASKVSP